MSQSTNSAFAFVQNNFSVLLVAAFFAGAGFFGGSIWTENKLLRQGQTSLGTNTAQVAPQPQAPTQPKVGTASVDDDPVMGDKNAPITMIEFSDYECPFCKRHFDQTLSDLKKKWIDTGKVKLVYRDLPLSFHDPMATKEAIAANCAREQGGDSKYFEYHDELFTRTKSNGNGLSDADLTTIATDLNLNLSSFNTCLDDPKQTAEVKKDVADAGKAGATGTPTFIIGKSSKNGEISGSLVSGAQPLAAFEAVFQTLE